MPARIVTHFSSIEDLTKVAKNNPFRTIWLATLLEGNKLEDDARYKEISDILNQNGTDYDILTCHCDSPARKTFYFYMPLTETITVLFKLAGYSYQDLLM